MKLGQGYVFTRVCDSVHRFCPRLPHCMLGYTQRTRGRNPPQDHAHPPGADTPTRMFQIKFEIEEPGSNLICDFTSEMITIQVSY